MTTLNLNQLSDLENIRFNETAQLIRKEYNDIVESVSMPHVHNIHWIVGNIASRNKYTSPLFMRLCSLAFIEAELQLRQDIHIIIVADKALAQVLRCHFRKIQRHIKICCTEKLTRQLWQSFRPIRQYLIALAIFGLRYLASRFKKPLQKLSNNMPITLIDTFVLNNKVGDEGSLINGEYKDRYYPGLLESLIEAERKSIFFLPTIIGFKNTILIFKQLRKAQTNFLVHDDFLKLSDYLFVFLHPWQLLRCKIPNVSFRHIDVTYLLRQENFRYCSDQMGLLGLLYYRFAYRLAQCGVNVRLLVDWNENQVIDRGMIVGFHRFHPKTKVVGYQGYIIAKSLHFYVYPNTTEWLGKAIPDVVYVVGEGLKADLLEFCKEIKVDVAPGFRFQKLWRERRFYPDADVYTVLVGLPIDLDDSAYMLELLAKSLPKLSSQGIRFWIKPHPTWSPDRIKQLLSAWPEAFEFKIGDFHDVVEGANLLISNASSVTLEALAKGVPVIIVGAFSGITQNPIPDSISMNIWTVIYTKDECIEAIKRFHQQSDIQGNIAMGLELRKKFFEPVNRSNVLKFLGL